MDEHIGQEALDVLLASYAPGWSGVVKERDGLPVLELSHRYSAGQHFVGRQGEVFDEARCRSLLDDPAIRPRLQLLANAPEGPSGRAISGFLTFVESFRWSARESTAVASLLVDSGGITVEEYDWLSEVLRRLEDRENAAPDSPAEPS